MPLTRALYYSENQLVRGETSVLAQLNQIMTVSNHNNHAVGITGALMFDELWFIQVLEGDREPVWNTFRRIADDERHSHVVLVEMREVPDRLFGNWWMGLATRNERTQAAFAPYLRNGRLSPVDLSASTMLDLIIDVAKLGLSREITASGTGIAAE